VGDGEAIVMDMWQNCEEDKTMEFWEGLHGLGDPTWVGGLLVDRHRAVVNGPGHYNFGPLSYHADIGSLLDWFLCRSS
jgi:hypothetical protein